MLVLLGPSGEWQTAVLACLFGAAALPLYAICAAHAFDVVERSEFVEASSGLLLANGIGSVIGPLVAAVAMDQIGPSGLFATTACFHVVLAAFAYWRSTRRAVRPEERTEFSLTSTAPTMVALEPVAVPSPVEPDDESGSRS